MLVLCYYSTLSPWAWIFVGSMWSRRLDLATALFSAPTALKANPFPWCGSAMRFFWARCSPPPRASPARKNPSVVAEVMAAAVAAAVAAAAAPTFRAPQTAVTAPPATPARMVRARAPTATATCIHLSPTSVTGRTRTVAREGRRHGQPRRRHHQHRCSRARKKQERAWKTLAAQ